MDWGGSAQTFAKIFAYFEIAISLCNFVAISFNAVLILGSPTALTRFVQRSPNDYKNFVKFLELNQRIQVVTLLLILTVCIIGLGLGLLLLNGTKKRNARQLRAWRVITAILYLLCLPAYLMWLVYSDDILTLVLSFVVIYFVGGLSFYIVYVLIYEIESGGYQTLDGL